MEAGNKNRLMNLLRFGGILDSIRNVDTSISVFVDSVIHCGVDAF